MPFLAVAIDFAGHAFMQAFGFTHDQSEQPLFILAFSCIPAGLVLGIMGIIRHESRRYLSIVGIILNSVLIASACFPIPAIT